MKYRIAELICFFMVHIYCNMITWSVAKQWRGKQDFRDNEHVTLQWEELWETAFSMQSAQRLYIYIEATSRVDYDRNCSIGKRIWP
jgi:hypothetical protein